MSETLEILFGSKARARLIRFFILNPEREYEASEAVKKNMLDGATVRREINALRKINLVVEKKKKGKIFYQLNSSFSFYPELQALITKSNVYPQCQGLSKFAGIGDVKLVLVGGIFINYPKSKADMILVVNSLNRKKLDVLIGNIEAEIGREINYVLMNSEEFKYRLDMLDRFILEFLENPHDELINKIPGLKRMIINLRAKRGSR